jgi:hypothetical protein
VLGALGASWVGASGAYWVPRERELVLTKMGATALGASVE